MEMPPIVPSDDYHVAEKLAQQLIRRMEPRYPRIIRKCIGHDFCPREFNLPSEELQESFLYQVVMGLHNLADDIAKLSWS